jgi:orotate phosphoribosyltransferase-like protein
MARKLKAKFQGRGWHLAGFSALSSRRLDSMAKTVLAFEKKIRKRFHVIACLGISGTVPATLLAARLGRGLFVVRRDGERPRSGNGPGPIGVKPISGQHLNYLLLDDLISMGGTMDRMIECVTQCGGKPVGIFLYDEGRSWPSEYSGIPIWGRNFKRSESRIREILSNHTGLKIQ